MKTKNVGLSKVSIEKRGTVLQLHSAAPPKARPPWPCKATWSGDAAVWDVFIDHEGIEPSEPIEDQVLVELPDDKAPAYRLTLKVMSGGIWWTVTKIVGTSEKHRITGGTYDPGPGARASRPE